MTYQDPPQQPGQPYQPPQWQPPQANLPPEAYQYTQPPTQGWQQQPPIYPPQTPRRHARKQPWWKKPWVAITGAALIALLIGVGIGAAGGKTKTAAATPTQSVTTTLTATITTTPTQVVSTAQVVTTVTLTPVPKTAFTDGVFQIGPDVPAGPYKTDGVGTSSQCYYAILNTTDTQNIATNAIVSGPTRVTLPAGKYLQTRGGCKWTQG